MLFPNGYDCHNHDFVFVFVDRDGCKRKSYTAFHAGVMLSDERSLYRLFGIFPNLAPNRLRHRPQRYHGEESYIGIPEGASIAFNGKELVVWYGGDNTSPHRREFQSRMKSFAKKARELMALGIERKAALAAARKCECVR